MNKSNLESDSGNEVAGDVDTEITVYESEDRNIQDKTEPGPSGLSVSDISQTSESRVVNICNAIDSQDDSDAHKNDNISCMEIVPDVTFIACIYDLRWWIGIVKQESAEHGDYWVNFMIPSGEAKQYSWPEKKDTCWIESTNILCTVETPFITSSSVRGYSLAETEIKRIADIFKQKCRH